MQATLDLPEDIYRAARSLAGSKRISLGDAVAELARRGLPTVGSPSLDTPAQHEVDRARGEGCATNPLEDSIVIREMLADFVRELDERERHLFRLVLEGLTVTEIAMKIGLSLVTVAASIRQIRSKLADWPQKQEGPAQLEVDPQIANLNDQIWELIVAHGNEPGLPALVEPLREQLRSLQRHEAEAVRRNFEAQLQFDPKAGMRFVEETEKLWNEP